MNRILFFGLKTISFSPKIQEVIQITWQIYTQKAELLTEHNYYLPCEIVNNIQYKGISQYNIDEFSNPHHEVFEYFFESVKWVDMIVCHNYNYDTMMLKKTIERKSLYKFSSDLELFLKKKYICTMISTTDFCNHSKKCFNPKSKLLNLHQLHNKLFDSAYHRKNNAFCDVNNTVNCFFALQKKGVIS